MKNAITFAGNLILLLSFSSMAFAQNKEVCELNQLCKIGGDHNYVDIKVSPTVNENYYDCKFWHDDETKIGKIFVFAMNYKIDNPFHDFSFFTFGNFMEINNIHGKFSPKSDFYSIRVQQMDAQNVNVLCTAG